MQVKIKKITDIKLAHAAIESTMQDGFEAKCNLKDLYLWEHSPSRTQMFWVEMLDIPSYCSVHLVRHSAVGQQHFVRSNRDDRRRFTWLEKLFPFFFKVHRNTPVNHSMLVNAQHLIDMSKVRLCYKASYDTRMLMYKIKDAVEAIDKDLATYMVPFCVYQGGYCHQPKPCGNYKVKRYEPEKIWKGIL